MGTLTDEQIALIRANQEQRQRSGWHGEAHREMTALLDHLAAVAAERDAVRAAAQDYCAKRDTYERYCFDFYTGEPKHDHALGEATQEAYDALKALAGGQG